MEPAEVAGAISTRDPRFRARAHAAIKVHGEAIVAYYLANGGGWQEWHLVRTPAELDLLLDSGKRRSIFDVYLTPQLPIRAVADPVSEAAVLAALKPRGEVFMAVPAEPGTIRAETALAVSTYLHHSGADEEGDVREWFAEHRGRSIVAGAHPADLPDDTSIKLTARVPDEDGKIRRAAF